MVLWLLVWFCEVVVGWHGRGSGLGGLDVGVVVGAVSYGGDCGG